MTHGWRRRLPRALKLGALVWPKLLIDARTGPGPAMTATGHQRLALGVLQRAELRNNAASLASIARMHPDGEVAHYGPVVLIATGSSWIFFNQIFVVRQGPASSVLRSAVDRMRQRGAPFMVSLRAGLDAGLMEVAAKQGLVKGDVIPAMAMVGLPEEVTSPPGLDIRRVGTIAGLNDHVGLVAEGFGETEDTVRDLLRPAILADARTACYVGYETGIAVTTALTYRTGSTLGIYNVATAPDRRRRGYAAAVTMSALAAGGRSGCRVAVLQASEMATALYGRIGFQVVSEYHPFAWP